MQIIDKTIEIALLYDFYSHLLTDKQQEMIDLYYNQDLSLGEIAETFQISRQAVYDTIKRTEKILYEYENKLRLIQITNKKTEDCEKLLEQLSILEAKVNADISKSEIISYVEGIKSELREMLNQ